jgi:predicted ATP-binding protein involved in virulence
MSGFKLLAIRPLKHTSEKYLKVLERYKIYQFYNDYTFYFKDEDLNGEVDRIEKTKQTPDLYSIEIGKGEDKRNLPLNISAIVGKNGSGKSTLTELFFLAVYNLSIKEELLLKDRNNKDLGYEPGVDVEFYYEIDSFFLVARVTCIEGLKNSNKVNCEVVFNSFKSNDKVKNRDFTIELLESDQNFFIKYFFYSVVINYSLYGLNYKTLGKWLDPLFHKNDGYKTPMVINPYRDKGKININNEDELVRQRLVANLLEPIENSKKPENSLRALTPNKQAIKLKLAFDKKKIQENSNLPEISNGLKVFNKLYRKYTGEIYKDKIDNEYSVGVVNYIIQKLVKICQYYNWYSIYFDSKYFLFKKPLELITNICKDESHITFKLKQALNFLKYPDIPNLSFEKSFTVNIEDYSKIIADRKTDKYLNSTIEKIPPSFFKCEILFANNKTLEDCSSGEKQKIYSTSSIIYHLININSVFKAKKENNKRYRYKNINLILDEIELYYHPEFQRTFIQDLLDSIKLMNPKSINFLNGINICFLTHSPFILSDIPASNIMFLEIPKNGNKTIQLNIKISTFGANIHELLADGFFMTPTIGEFSSRKIIELANWLESFNSNDEIEFEKERRTRENKNTIALIGESLIKDRMMELYYSKMGEDSEIEELRKRVEVLENKIQKK